MLPDAERFRLLHGPYRAPKCRVGRWLKCRLRGRVKVVAISDAPIQWPMTRLPTGGPAILILCGDLMKAVRCESSLAVQHWWGVKADLVWRWRKALGVEQHTAGTMRLHSKGWTDGGTGEASRPGREAAFHSPERAAKIAAAKRGKPRPPHVAELLRSAQKGTKHTKAARRKMREAAALQGHRKRNGRPFSVEEDALLGTKTDREVAQRTGRHFFTVVARRRRLGIKSHRKQTVKKLGTWGLL
jgi:hypothetical protein